MRTILFFFCFAVMSFPAVPQALQWKPINGFPGCWLLREGEDKKLFAVTNTNVLQSGDDGLSWSVSSVPAGEIWEFVSRNEIQIVRRYMPNAPKWDQAHMSTDDGATWTLIMSARGGYGNYTISDSGTIFALYTSDQGDGIVRFNGQMWDSIGTLLNIYSTSGLLIDHSGNFIIPGSSIHHGVNISTDSGGSWHRALETHYVTSASIGPRNEMIVGASVTSSNNNDGGVFVSTDLGWTWEFLGLYDKHINSISADDNGNIYVAAAEGVYLFNYETRTFEDISPTQASYAAILAASSGTVFANTGDGYSVRPDDVLFRSTDRGSFWSPSGPGGNEIFSLISPLSGTILAGTLGDRIFKTRNGGDSWYQLPPGSVGDYVYAIEKNASLLFACTDDGLYSSVDAGDNWVNLTEKYFGGSSYAAVFRDGGILLTGTNFGVYKSTDSGSAWRMSGLENMKIYSLAGDKAGNIYAVTENHGIFSSPDNGATWVSRGLVRNDIQTIAVSDAGDVYVGVYGGIVKSTNGGADWVQSNVSANTYVYTLGFSGHQDVFAGTYNGLFRSTNSGLSWSVSGFTGQTVLALAFDEMNNLMTGLYSGGVYISSQPVTSVSMTSAEIPAAGSLHQNLPNPFNPTTEIRFQLSENGFVKLTVFDILGREAATLLNEWRNAGSYSIHWDGSNFPSGVYFCRLEAGAQTVGIKKMVLVR